MDFPYSVRAKRWMERDDDADGGRVFVQCAMWFWDSERDKKGFRKGWGWWLCLWMVCATFKDIGKWGKTVAHTKFSLRTVSFRHYRYYLRLHPPSSPPWKMMMCSNCSLCCYTLTLSRCVSVSRRIIVSIRGSRAEAANNFMQMMLEVKESISARCLQSADLW